MEFVLKIDLGNAAMQSPEHVARALEQLAVRLRDLDRWRIPPGEQTGTIRDTNGNKVGQWSAEWPESEES